MHHLSRLSSLRWCALLAPCFAAADAAPITWATPVNCAGDSDVSTSGSLSYAYNWANATQTINGVAFTGTNSITTVGTNLTLTGWGNSNTTAFTTTSNPFNSLSTAYKNALKGSIFNSTTGGTNTVTLNNLISGRQYQVQFWVSDPRGSTRTGTLTSVGGNSVNLNYCTTTGAGGVGQYSIGTFTADAATQAFTFTTTTSTQMNMLQVRDVSPPPTKAGTGTDLAEAASWVDSAPPIAGLIATWNGSSLGAGLTLDAPVTWGGINASGALSDISISGTGALTLGSAGIAASGANLTLANPITLGAAQTWTPASGKTITVSGTVDKGANALLISGAGSVAMTGSLTGTGALYADGTLNYSATGGTTNDFRVGNGANGAFTISGGDLTVSAVDVLFCQGGTNSTFTQTGGTLNLGAGFFKGANNAGQTGSIDVSGGIWTGSGTFMTNQRGTGTLTVSGSADMTVGLLALGGWVNDAKTSTVNLDGGLLSASAISEQLSSPSTKGANGGTTSTFNFNGGTLRPTASSTLFMPNVDTVRVKQGGAIIDTNGNDITIGKGLVHDSGLVTADGGLLKKGVGILTLSGPCTYNGNTTVTEGILAIGNGGSTTSPVIDVAAIASLSGGSYGAGQTVQGTGSLEGALTIGAGATLSPAGDAATGSMIVSGTLTLGGTTRMQIVKSGGVLSGDQLTGTGSVVFGGTLEVTASGQALSLGNSIQLFAHGGGSTGSFSSVSLPALPGGLSWDYSNLATTGAITVSNSLSSPLFSPAAGNYYGPQTVTLTGDPGSTIYYTMDGSTPTASSPNALTPITGLVVPVDAATTIKAFARKAGLSDSAVATGVYQTTSFARWNEDNNGQWSEAAKWFLGVIPDGPGVPVDFATTHQSAPSTVTVDSNRTVGALTFGNDEPIAWTLDAANGAVLTLAGTSDPAITVQAEIPTTISVPLAGTQGLIKNGAGALTVTTPTYAGATTVNDGYLKLNAPAYTGATTINAGTLELNGSLATYSGGAIQINNGAILKTTGNKYDFSGKTFTFGNAGGGTINVASDTLFGGFVQISAGNTFVTTGGARCEFTGTKYNLNPNAVTFDIATGTDASSDLRVALDLWNAGSVIKNGAGRLEMAGATTYSGGTTVNAGSLLATNVSGSATGTGAVTVKSGASLGGTGSIGGAVTIESGATVNPGVNGTGTLTVANATMAGVYHCDIDPVVSDMINVTGTLTLSGSTSITFSGSPSAGSYVIASYGTLAGTLPAVTAPSGYHLVDDSTAKQILLVKDGGYATWADSWPGLTDKTQGGDPDGDGLSNLMEYVLGGDPRSSSSSVAPTQAIVGANLVISYKRSDDSESDTTQKGQWSTNLTAWTDIAPVLVNENGTAPDDMTITIPQANAAGGRLFGRLRVTAP